MIPDPEFFQQYYRYVIWADKRQLAEVRSLPEAAYRQDHGFSFETIHRVLLHELAAQSVWLDRYAGVQPLWLMEDPQLDSLAAIEQRWAQVHERGQDFMAGVTAEKLASELRYANLAGKEFSLPLWMVVFHMCQHGYYHRGQLSSMIKLAGGETVSTDFIVWAAEQGKQ